MTYPNPHYGAPTPPRKSRRGLVIALIMLGVGVLLLCGVSVVIDATSKPDAGARGLAVVTSPDPTFSATPAAKSTPRPTPGPSQALSAKTLRLTIKITSKQCFGSAGCLLEWQVRGEVTPGTKIDGPCDVTYEVHGLEDAQTHSMTVNDDGTYEQDAYQTGQTSGSAKKLAAKVTEVECS